MKLRVIKPIYYEGVVLSEGEEFESPEQRGRELLKKGYATEASSEQPEEKPRKGKK